MVIPIKEEKLLDQKYVDVIQLAKEIEIWAASVRYKDNNINERISLDDIFHLNKIATGQLVLSNDLEHISCTLKDFERVEKAPEHIKNKLLLLNAFYAKKQKSPEITGTVPQLYYTNSTVIPTEIKVEFIRSSDWDGPFCSVKK